MILGVCNVEHILDCVVRHTLRPVEQSVSEASILQPFSPTSHLSNEAAVQVSHHLVSHPFPLVNPNQPSTAKLHDPKTKHQINFCTYNAVVVAVGYEQAAVHQIRGQLPWELER
jgi:hypothetical protein